ncbi:hypothetical protein WMY93_019629 [Mugilogobius chulae]|uniref:Uncharacterized protein n=1 Tax=Mugilogobius chulae TaxID=88201 RepID=A0AAW0NLN3_9GOBI
MEKFGALDALFHPDESQTGNFQSAPWRPYVGQASASAVHVRPLVASFTQDVAGVTWRSHLDQIQTSDLTCQTFIPGHTAEHELLTQTPEQSVSQSRACPGAERVPEQSVSRSRACPGAHRRAPACSSSLSLALECTRASSYTFTADTGSSWMLATLP